MTRFIVVFFSLYIVSFVQAQQGNEPLNYRYLQQLNRHLDSRESNFHTAIRPYLISEVEASISKDSAFSVADSAGFGDNFTQGNIISAGNDKFNFRLNPVIDLQAGYDISSKELLYSIGYGAKLDADLSRFVTVSATYRGIYEKPADYLSAAYASSGVVTGYRNGASRNDGTFTSYEVTGYVSVTPTTYFNLQAGYDRHFWGEGYRSLFLSDNAPAYPFLKLTANFWKIKYTYLLNFMQYGIYDPIETEWDWGRKNGAFHYLSIDIAKWFQFGFFEGVVWQYSDSTRTRGIEFNYLNPLVFIRPIEFALGSPDNVILGINLKFKPHNNHIIYSQIVLDDLDIGKARQGRGFYRTKIAIQGGYRGYDLFNIKGLSLFAELNLARPFVYAHKEPAENYSHHNQALAHPLGANFLETIIGVSYQHNRWRGSMKFQYAKQGTDEGLGRPSGSNIYISDFLISPTLATAYDNKFLQGQSTKYLNTDLRVGYVINPIINLVAEAFWNYRDRDIAGDSQKSSVIGVRLSTDLFNRYTDF